MNGFYDEDRNLRLATAHELPRVLNPVHQAEVAKDLLKERPNLERFLIGSTESKPKPESKSGLPKALEDAVVDFLYGDEEAPMHTIYEALLSFGQKDLAVQITQIAEARRSASGEREEAKRRKAREEAMDQVTQRHQNQIIEKMAAEIVSKERIAKEIADALKAEKEAELRAKPFEIQIVTWAPSDLRGETNSNSRWRLNLAAFVKSADTPTKQLELFDWAKKMSVVTHETQLTQKVLFAELGLEVRDLVEARKILAERAELFQQQARNEASMISELAWRKTQIELAEAKAARLVKIRQLPFEEQLANWQPEDLLLNDLDLQNVNWRNNMFSLIRSAQSVQDKIALIDWLTTSLNVNKYEAFTRTSPAEVYLTTVKQMLQNACTEYNLPLGSDIPSFKAIKGCLINYLQGQV